MIELKKGDKCIVKGFTGIKLGIFTVAAVSKKTVTVLKANGDEMIFDRKTGRQVNVEEGKEKYANTVMEDDGSYVAPNRAKKEAKKTSKKTVKKPKPEPEDEDDDDEEEEAPVKKPTKKTSKKTAKKPEPEPEEDDEDDFEEDDEDFEEIDD